METLEYALIDDVYKRQAEYEKAQAGGAITQGELDDQLALLKAELRELLHIPEP